MIDVGKGKLVSGSFITALIAVVCAIVAIINFILFLPWIKTETEITEYGSSKSELSIAPGKSYSFTFSERRDSFDRLSFIINEQTAFGVYVILSSEDGSRTFYEGEAEIEDARDEIRGEFRTAVIKGLFDRGSYKLSIRNTSDEENLIICLIAREMGCKNTIARVRNPVYNNEINFIKEACFA